MAATRPAGSAGQSAKAARVSSRSAATPSAAARTSRWPGRGRASAECALDREPFLVRQRMLQRLAYRREVPRSAGADHYLSDPQVGKQPGQRETGQRGATGGGDHPQAVQDVEGMAGQEFLVRLGT